jgi:hypothetical protein
MNKKLLKGITVTVFATLLTIVVLDQSGYFDSEESKADTIKDRRGENPDQSTEDQAVGIDTSHITKNVSEKELVIDEKTKREMMSTSKSTIVQPSNAIDNLVPGLLLPE